MQDLVVILRQNSSNITDDDNTISERKLLEQRLEEAHLHLADIKTSWSDKIASLETQVSLALDKTKIRSLKYLILCFVGFYLMPLHFFTCYPHFNSYFVFYIHIFHFSFYNSYHVFKVLTLLC